VLLVTHDRDAAAIADRCCTLRDGKLIEDESDSEMGAPFDSQTQSASAQG